MADLPLRLKTHLYNMLTNNLTWEYMDQIERWKIYILQVVDAAKSAQEAQVDTLRQAHAEVEEARQAALAGAMFMLSMFAGAAVAWLGAAIQVKWSPKLTAATKTVYSIKPKLLNNKYLTGFAPRIATIVKTPNPMADKFFGDIGKNAASWLFSIAQKGLTSQPKPFQAPDTKFVERSNNWESFATGLTKALYEQQQFGLQQIRQVANSVENDPGIWRNLVEQLFKEQPKLRTLTGKDADDKQYLAGAAMINKALNRQRATWADEWFYYGNNPPAIKWDMDTLYERELWALWLLEENISVQKDTIDLGPDDLPSQAGKKVQVVTVHSKSDLVMTKTVHSKLLHLAVPVMAYDPRFQPDTIDRGLYDAIDEMDKYGEQHLRAGIGRLNDWAKSHLPELGPLDFGVPRNDLESIETYTGHYKEYKN